jgi:hypothetical protein
MASKEIYSSEEIATDRNHKITEFSAALESRYRSPLAEALLEDEIIRDKAVRLAREYVTKNARRRDHVPFWVWCVLWFIVGMLFDMSVTNLGQYLR